MGDLREDIREGTLRRMRRALAEAVASLRGLLDDSRAPGDTAVREAETARHRLVASIEEVEGQAPRIPALG